MVLPFPAEGLIERSSHSVVAFVVMQGIKSILFSLPLCFNCMGNLSKKLST